MERTALEMEAQALGFPATLFGYTPNDFAYWFEPGLPWLIGNSPGEALDRRGGGLILHLAEVRTQRMAPRFPEGCVVNIAPVYERANLVIGCVYLYRYTNSETGEESWSIGRLVKVGGNALWALADNEPKEQLCWLLRDREVEAVWDVYEVTHYAQYPEL